MQVTSDLSFIVEDIRILLEFVRKSINPRSHDFLEIICLYHENVSSYFDGGYSQSFST